MASLSNRTLSNILIFISLCAYLLLLFLRSHTLFFPLLSVVLFAIIYANRTEKNIIWSKPTFLAFAGVLIALLTDFYFAGIRRQLIDIDNILLNLGISSPKYVFFALLAALVVLSVPVLLFCLQEVGKDSKPRFGALFTPKCIYRIGAVFSLLAVGCVLISTCSLSITNDEAFSLTLVEYPLNEIIDLTGRDVHPPLYYIILKYGMGMLLWAFPDMPGICAAKLVSALPFILMIGICLLYVKKKWGRRAAGFSLLLLCCAPRLIEYGVTIRMYTWVGLFVVCSFLQAWRTMKKDTFGNWLALAIFSLLAIYTNYWAAIPLAIIFLYLGIWSIRKSKWTFLRWGATVAICTICFTPWLPILMEQMHQESQRNLFKYKAENWIKHSILHAEIWAHMPYSLLIGLASIIFLTRIYRIKNLGGNKRFFSMGLSIYGLSFIFTVVALALHPIRFYGRLLQPGLLCSIVSLSLLITQRRKTLLVQIIYLALVVLSIHSIYSFVEREYNDSAATNSFIQQLQRNSNAIYIAHHGDLYLTITRYTDSPSYANEALVPIMELVYSKKKLASLESEEQVQKLLRAGKNVYYITHLYYDQREEEESREKLDTLLQATGCVAHKCGVYRQRWVIWHMYRLEPR